jgi:hypothetical protein
MIMRYEDYYDGYNYDYDELVENTEDLGLDEEPWMDGYEDSEEDDDEVPSYGRNYYPSIEDDQD